MASDHKAAEPGVLEIVPVEDKEEEDLNETLEMSVEPEEEDDDDDNTETDADIEDRIGQIIEEEDKDFCEDDQSLDNETETEDFDVEENAETNEWLQNYNDICIKEEQESEIESEAGENQIEGEDDGLRMVGRVKLEDGGMECFVYDADSVKFENEAHAETYEAADGNDRTERSKREAAQTLQNDPQEEVKVFDAQGSDEKGAGSQNRCLFHTGVLHPEGYQCEKCRKVFSLVSAVSASVKKESATSVLTAHAPEAAVVKATRHAQKKPRKTPGDARFTCEFCGKECAKSSELQKHRRVHTGQQCLHQKLETRSPVRPCVSKTRIVLEQGVARYYSRFRREALRLPSLRTRVLHPSLHEASCGAAQQGQGAPVQPLQQVLQ